MLTASLPLRPDLFQQVGPCRLVVSFPPPFALQGIRPEALLVEHRLEFELAAEHLTPESILDEITEDGGPINGAFRGVEGHTEIIEFLLEIQRTPECNGWCFHRPSSVLHGGRQSNHIGRFRWAGGAVDPRAPVAAFSSWVSIPGDGLDRFCPRTPGTTWAPSKRLRPPAYGGSLRALVPSGFASLTKKKEAPSDPEGAPPPRGISQSFNPDPDQNCPIGARKFAAVLPIPESTEV